MPFHWSSAQRGRLSRSSAGLVRQDNKAAYSLENGQ